LCFLFTCGDRGGSRFSLPSVWGRSGSSGKILARFTARNLAAESLIDSVPGTFRLNVLFHAPPRVFIGPYRVPMKWVMLLKPRCLLPRSSFTFKPPAPQRHLIRFLFSLLPGGPTAARVSNCRILKHYPWVTQLVETVDVYEPFSSQRSERRTIQRLENGDASSPRASFKF